MKNHGRQIRGFTIAEVSASIAVVAVLVLIITTQIVMAKKTIADTTKAAELAEIEHEIQMILGSSFQCTTNFQGLTLAAPGQSIEVENLREFHPDKRELRVVTGTGVAHLSGLRTMGVRIRTLAQITPSETVAQVDFRFRGIQSGDQAVTKAEVVRSFPIYAILTENRLTQCAARSESSWLMSESVCGIFNGGYYDVATNKCRFPDYVWVPGTAQEASCPEGLATPTDGGRWDNCWPEEPPGFEDPFESVSDQYADGSSESGRPGAATVGFVPGTRTCRCYYATGIDPTDWVCWARCLEN